MWGAVMSPYFTISNVVRQGGILSPSLFAVYMDDLSSLGEGIEMSNHVVALPYIEQDKMPH